MARSDAEWFAVRLEWRRASAECWGAGDDHWQWQEVAPHSVQNEPERFERDRAEQRRIPHLSKNRRRRSALILVEKQRVTAIAFDRRAISQPEALLRMRRDTQPGEDLAR